MRCRKGRSSCMQMLWDSHMQIGAGKSSVTAVSDRNLSAASWAGGTHGGQHIRVELLAQRTRGPDAILPLQSVRDSPFLAGFTSNLRMPTPAVCCASDRSNCD